MQNFRRLFTCLKILGDLALIVVSFCVGYVLKFKLYWFGIGEITPSANFPDYWEVMIYIEVLWLLAFAYTGLYRYFQGPLARMREITAAVVGVSLGVLEVMAFSFLYTTFPGSRYVLVYSGLSAILLISLYRVILAKVMAILHFQGYANKRAVIIGSSPTAQRIAEKILQYPEYGFKYCGFIADRKPEHIIYPLKKNFIKLGRLKEYAEVCKKHKIAAVFADSDILSAEDIYNIVEFCRKHGIYFRYHSEAFSKNIFWEDLDAINLIGLKEQKFSEINRLLKRTADLILVIPALLIACPLMLLIYFGIKITSPGPAIYRQTRLTRAGREFQFLKFRSMPVDSEKDGAVLAVRDQKHRTTRFGYFIRKTSLDELPQLFNVLKGDMSIVGPRPERPVFHRKYLETVPRWNERLAVKGGITGWAQLNGRAELTASPQEKLEYDVYYIENWSLLFDIMVLWRTFWHVLKQKDVY